MDPDTFAPFKPDGDALLRRISKHIDDPALQRIAELGPGGAVEAHLRALRKMRGQGIVGRPLTWEPREVLEFISSSEPDANHRMAWELRGTPGHWARTFSCAVLLRAYGDVETRQIIHSGYNAAIIQLLESIRRIDAGMEADAMAALAWFILRLHTSNEAGVEGEIAFAGLALLSLAVRSRNLVPDSAILCVAKWLLTHEQRTIEAWGEGYGDFNSLFRTTYFMFPEKWMALGVELAAVEAGSPGGAAVRAIGQRLTAS